jgi:hypothetical protein
VTTLGLRFRRVQDHKASIPRQEGRGNEQARDELKPAANGCEATAKISVSSYNACCAPVAQLDRASAFEAEGRGFESLRARHCIWGPARTYGL